MIKRYQTAEMQPLKDRLAASHDAAILAELSPYAATTLRADAGRLGPVVKALEYREFIADSRRWVGFLRFSQIDDRASLALGSGGRNVSSLITAPHQSN